MEKKEEGEELKNKTENDQSFICRHSKRFLAPKDALGSGLVTAFLVCIACRFQI